MVVSRQLLIRVAVAVVVFLVIAFPVGDKHQGVLGVVGNVTWYGFLLSFLLLIVWSRRTGPVAATSGR